MVVDRKNISQRGLDAWENAVAAYESQIGTFWASMDAMRKEIRTYGEAGFRLWDADRAVDMK
jgi:hypothetical protein